MGNYGGYSSRAAQRQNVRYAKQAVAKAQSQSAATGRSIAAANQAALKPGTITDYTKTGVIITGKDTATGKTISAYYDPSGKRTTAFATSEAYQKYTPEQLSLLTKDILSPSEKEQVIKIKEMYKQERPSLLRQQPANMTRQQKEEVARIRQEQSNAKQYGTFQEYMAERQPMSFQQPTQTFKNKEGQIKGFESPILQQSIYAGKGYYEPTTQRQIKAAERETYFRQLPQKSEDKILPTQTKQELSFAEKAENIRQAYVKQSTLAKFTPLIDLGSRFVTAQVIFGESFLKSASKLTYQKFEEFSPKSFIQLRNVYRAKNTPDINYSLLKPSSEDYLNVGVVGGLSLISGGSAAIGKPIATEIGLSMMGLGGYQYLTADTEVKKTEAVGIFGLGALGSVGSVQKFTSDVFSTRTFEALARSKKAQVNAPSKRVMSKAQMRERKTTPRISQDIQTGQIVLYGKNTQPISKRLRIDLNEKIITREFRSKRSNILASESYNLKTGQKTDLTFEPLKRYTSKLDFIQQRKGNLKQITPEERNTLLVQLKSAQDFRISIQKQDKTFKVFGQDLKGKYQYSNILERYGEASTILETKQTPKGSYESVKPPKGFRMGMKERILAKLYTQRDLFRAKQESNIMSVKSGQIINPQDFKTNWIQPSKYAAGGAENPLVVVTKKPERSLFGLFGKAKKNIKYVRPEDVFVESTGEDVLGIGFKGQKIFNPLQSESKVVNVFNIGGKFTTVPDYLKGIKTDIFTGIKFDIGTTNFKAYKPNLDYSNIKVFKFKDEIKSDNKNKLQGQFREPTFDVFQGIGLKESIKIKSDIKLDSKIDSKLDLGISSVSSLIRVPTVTPTKQVQPEKEKDRFRPIFVPDWFTPRTPEPYKPIKPPQEPPPEEIIVDIPQFDFIGGAGNKRKKKKKYNMFYIPKNKYTPSVEAIQFKVYGKQPKRAGARELSIRPMVIK